jgi:hypothetical protein
MLGTTTSVLSSCGTPAEKSSRGRRRGVIHIVTAQLVSAAASWLAATPTPGTAFPTQVVARHLFYNDSAFDGDPGASAADDLAIAPNKQPLLPGTGGATSANFSNFVEGITGVMIDVAALPPTALLTAADFAFRTGNENDTSNWSTAASPISITVRRGAGQGGTDRITLVWAAGSIADTWLEIRLRSNPNTGLTTADLFYFGNARGDTTGEGTVNASDFAAVRANPRTFLNPAAVDDLFDLNRDRHVNGTDLLLVRSHATSLNGGLNMITPSEASQPFSKQVTAPPKESIMLAERNQSKKLVTDEDSVAQSIAEAAPLSDDGRAAILASFTNVGEQVQVDDVVLASADRGETARWANLW